MFKMIKIYSKKITHNICKQNVQHTEFGDIKET